MEGAAATATAPRASFNQLLGGLIAEHERVVLTNKALSSENAALRGQVQELLAGRAATRVPDEGAPELNPVLFEDSASATTSCCIQACSSSSRPPPLALESETASEVPRQLDAYVDTQVVVIEGDRTLGTSVLSPTVGLARTLLPVENKPCIGHMASPSASPTSRLSVGQQARRGSRDLQSPSGEDGNNDSEGQRNAVKELELWPVWTTDSGEVSLKTQQSSTSMLLQQTQLESVRGGGKMKEDSILQPCVLGPNSTVRIVWDIISMIVVSFDVLTVPLTAFNGLDTPLMTSLGLFTTVFWTTDIPLSFLSGYYDGGIIEMRPRRIARNYVTHWFLLDFLIISVDWVLFFVQSGLADVLGIVRITKTLRLSRILRLFRLVRVLKLPGKLDDLMSNFHSETLLTVLGIARSMALIGVVNHFIACGWYATSWMEVDARRRWVWRLDEEGRDLGFRYLTSLHWSLTQFTPASMEIFPQNSWERLYAIFILFSALVVFSTFVSSITTAMSNLRRINMERSKQRENIRRYISYNQLSLELGNQILAFVRTHNFMARRRVHADDVTIFKVLPEAMKLQLHWEVYAFRLTPHPLFHHYQEADAQALFEICNRAMSEVSVSTSHDLFLPGQTANRVFFALSGVCEYHQGGLHDAHPIELDTGEGHWFCEVVLWVKWEHKGRLSAVTVGEFVALDAQQFRKITLRRPEIIGASREYARMYRQRAMELDSYIPLEIWVDFDQLQELVHLSFSHAPVDAEAQQKQAQPGKFMRLWRSWSPGHPISRKSDKLVLAPPRRCSTL